ncbi:MAG: acyltransferase [Bacteroidetes bacterium]|nr:acyltransferase [Bacteroidota bacterium]
MEGRKIYFPGLNGLRFWAAFFVILHHCEQFKLWQNMPNLFRNTFFESIGHQGVSLFFVLSGFLITFLLLAEYEKTHHIAVKNFYIRRILRIWPLYYLIMILGLFVLPRFINIGPVSQLPEHFSLKILLFMFMLPNVLRVMEAPIVGANQAWSVGVEEQFYIIWPLLVRTFRKVLLKFLILFIVLKFTVTVMMALSLDYVVSPTYAHMAWLRTIQRFWDLLQIEQMCFGAIGAYVLFYKKEKILNAIYHPLSQIFMAVGIVVILTVKFKFIGQTLFDALLFTILILNVSTNKKFILKLENKVYSYLGNISYGIYMFHTVCITIVLTILQKIGLDTSNFVLFNILLYVGSVLLTIAVAGFSYKYFESFFLKQKERFMIVMSSTRRETKAPHAEAIKLGKMESTSEKVINIKTDEAEGKIA